VLQRFRAVRKNEGGFTLIELLIVIVILGILTGIVVFAVGAFSDRGEVAACKTDKKTVEVAVEAYKAKNSKYPTAVADAAPPAATDPTTLVGGGFLREAPSSTKYTITYTPPSAGVVGGTVTGNLGVPPALGAAC
jgi:general secretion pathway protein G